MTQAKPEPSYETLKSELDKTLAALQRDDLSVDKALEYYQRGLDLVQQLGTYLKTAENKVTELKTKFGTGSS